MDIRKDFTVGAPRDAVWAALTDPEVIVSWGGGPAVMAPVPGFAFSLWDGDIHGTVTAADPGLSMSQEWYSGDWTSPSLVTFTLSDDPEGGTRVELVQTGVPDDEAAEIDAGWDEYYFEPLTRLLEEGEAWV
jgi:activator of HSP90 ATPase